MAPEDLEALYKFAHEEGLRGLEVQAAALDALYNRTGMLLAASSISSAFLGGLALDRSETLSIWSYLAVVSLLATFVLVGLILWPRVWLFQRSTSTLIENYIDGGPIPMGPIYRILALHLEQDMYDNEEQIGKLLTWFKWACVALAFSLVLWLVDLTMGVDDGRGQQHPTATRTASATASAGACAYGPRDSAQPE